ncbi:diflavin oxidoreductase [Pseudochelatococcus sp. B33]
MKIPYIPDDAPFSSEQRAWLAGFLAGLNSRLALETGPAAHVPAATVAAAQAPARKVHVLYGSQTGNAESVAESAVNAARKRGLEPVLLALDEVDLAQFAAMEHVLVVVSTYGEGEMPDNAGLFWAALSADAAPRLEGMTYAVLALGDRAYDGFCEAGKLVDLRLEQLGATRAAARVDCDVDYDKPAYDWIATTLPLFVPGGQEQDAFAAAPAQEVSPASAKAAWSRRRPYPARLAVNRRLSGESSGKDIRHYELDLGDSGISYEAGDALGVMPVNDAALVALLLERLGRSPDTPVANVDRPLGELLARGLEIATPAKDLIAHVAAHASGAQGEVLRESWHAAEAGERAALDAFLWGKDVLDLLNVDPALPLDADTFAGLLRPLQHRAYSISSSPLLHSDRVHLTISTVHWSQPVGKDDGRARGGVCSSWLAGLADGNGGVGIFLQQNKAFRPPAADDAPMIMVGPGTGIAPFRAFLQHRQARGAQGRNWLFFGDQRRASDFLYENELVAWSAGGLLTRLDLAFSRDQAEKVYVQHRMHENGRDLFDWLEQGGHFYVCGDAGRMAKDVDRALHEIIAKHGDRSVEEATDYVNTLRKEKRYLRDVY